MYALSCVHSQLELAVAVTTVVALWDGKRYIIYTVMCEP